MQPQVAIADEAAAPPAKVIVLSDLGTKKLVRAEEAHAQSQASSSVAAELARWQASPSIEELPPLLKQLDELLQFDLAVQQRAVSAARQFKPEDAEYVVDTVIKRLREQAAEMQTCVEALKNSESRLLLLLPLYN